MTPGATTPRLWYEDFPAGEVVEYGDYHVSAEEIIEFAREFDPQPFHLDEEAARKSILGGLCASGWHVCAIFMRMMFDGFIRETASMGSPGVEEVKWLKPVYAGETLHCRRTTLEARRSASRPDMGLVKFRWELFGAEGEKTTDIVATCLLAVRAAK